MQPIAVDPAEDRQVRPRDPVEMWLVQRWREVLGFPVGIGDNFFGMGGNSLDAARVLHAVREEFGIQLPLNALALNPEVGTLAAELRGRQARLPGPLVEIQYGEGVHPPLFLIHPASGQVGPYGELASGLGEEFAVVGVQAVGLYSGEEPLDTVPAMAARYVAELRSVQPDGPYCLGGCSTGSMVAVAMARQLVDAGARVRLLAAIDPGLVPDVVAADDTTDFARRAHRVRQANDVATRNHSPGPYPGTIDVFRAPGSQPEPDWSAVAPCRVHDCPDGGALARQLSRLIADTQP